MQRQKHRQAKLQTKLFRGYFFLAILILFSFATFFYVFVSKQLISSQVEAMNALNDSFYAQVESSLKNLDTVSINLNYINISKEVLDQSFGLTISSSMLDNMTELFTTLSGAEVKADQLNLYDFSGNMLQTGYLTMVKKTDEDRLSFLEQAGELGSSKILTKPYKTREYSKSAGYDQWFISLFRDFSNQYGRHVGTIEVIKGCNSVFKSIITYEKQNQDSASHIYIFDENGELIYPYDIADEEMGRIRLYYPIVTDLPSDFSFNSPIDGSKVYAATETSHYSGYTYVTIQPESAILEPVSRLLWILFLAILAFLAAAAFIAYRLSRSVVRPVKHLKHIIQRMELDTLGKEKATSYPVSVNELEELYQAFQHMSDSLKDSMVRLVKSQEQEIKSRTLALQTQINPHFYYNSLSSIIVLAENGDSDTVVRMCRNLSNIMRYITDTTSPAVTLREEIDYVQKYLYCMKVRYQSSLDYDIRIPEELMEERIPKLLIQPMVENAIKYGSDCEPPWQITVRGVLTEDHWQIDILDSGNGFTEEALEQIRRSIGEAEKNPGMPELKIHGLGTLNVYLRWKLFCKTDIIFSCGNTEEGHGIVSIGRYLKSPAQKGENL